MRAGDRERLARVALGRLAEPNDRRVWVAVARHGAVEALDRLAAGHQGLPAPRGVADPGRAGVAPLDQAADELDRAVAAGARFVVPGDLEWPSQLGDLDLDGTGDDSGPPAAPPLGLWVRGTHDLRLTAIRSVAVVGSRAATAYGVRVAGDLAAGLADRGWAVVSGAAYGIDAAAHRGSLAAGGVTVAVLASGVDQAYPRAHQALIDRMADEGLVVSELPPGSHPSRARFLDRNRLIAALTPGTTLVEAALRSGAANTGAWARRMSRAVLAVPGPVTSALSAGVHREIRERGALLVTGAADVVAAVGTLRDALAVAAEEDSRLALFSASLARPHDRLDPDTARVLDELSAGRFAAVAELAAVTGLDPARIASAAADLVAAGLAEATGPDGRPQPGAQVGRSSRLRARPPRGMARGGP